MNLGAHLNTINNFYFGSLFPSKNYFWYIKSSTTGEQNLENQINYIHESTTQPSKHQI